MLFDDTYRTLEAESEGIFRDKGSKFLAFAYPVTSENEVKALVSNLRSIHPKARHFCWALRVTPDRSIFRFQDDGEPSGTAGRPILNALLSADITNVLVVVVRYFGGTLLGVPGLINAYRTAAAEALGAGKVVEKTVNDIYELSFDFPLMNEVMRVIKDEEPAVLDQQFDNLCVIKIAVRKTSLDRVLSKLAKLEGLKSKYLFTA